MSNSKCDTCGRNFDIIKRESKKPGGGVSGCPEDSESCGMQEDGFNITVKERDDDE